MTVDEFASALNKLRIIPRLLVIASTWYYGIFAYDLVTWYMALPIRTVEDAAFVGGTVTTLGGILKFMIDTYIKTGNKE